MGAIADAFAEVYRDHVASGLPVSGDHEPEKSAIRALGQLLEQTISASGTALNRYATVADRDAVTDGPEGQLAYVYENNGSPSDPANGVYQWNGTAWVAAPWYFSAVSAIVQPLVTQALDAATAAGGSAAAAAASAASIAGQADVIAELKDIVAAFIKATPTGTLRIADAAGNYTQEIGASGSGVSTKPVIDLTIATGQSLSTGWSPGLTASRGLSSLSMFVGGLRIANTTPPATAIPAGALDALVPLAATTHEPFIASCAEWLHDNAGLNVIAVTCGVNGQAYSFLAKGQQPYTNLIAVVTAAQAFAVAQGARLRVSVCWQHGEADFTDSRATYRGKIDALTNDLNTDIIAITGQDVVHVFAGQSPSLSQSQVPLAIYEKAKADSRFHLVGPLYDLPFADSQHPDNYGHHHLGYIYGRAMKRVLKDGLAHKPFQPKTAIRSAATITVTMEGQTGVPQIDTVGVADRGAGKGFQAFTSGGVAVAISSVAATNTGYVLTFADSAAASSVATLMTAWAAPAATTSPQGSILGARTNLCDQDGLTDSITTLKALPQRCVISEIAVS